MNDFEDACPWCEYGVPPCTCPEPEPIGDIPDEGEWIEGSYEDGQMVDLGGGMVVPLREMFDHDA